MARQRKRKVYGLARISGPGRANALETQNAIIDRIADEKGLEVVGRLDLDGVSGTRSLKHPKVKELMEAITKPGIHGVVCSDLDRIARPDDFQDWAVFSVFRKSRVVIYANGQEFDPRERDYLLRLIIYLAIAAQERSDIIRRTQESKRRARFEKGWLASGDGLWNTPAGITFDQRTKEWRLVNDEDVKRAARGKRRFELAGPDALPRIVEAFSMFARGDDIASIIEKTGLGVPGCRVGQRSARRQWNKSAMLALGNPLYIGEYHCTHATDRDTGKPMPVEKPVIHKVMKPLITRKVWARCQERLRASKGTRAPRNDGYGAAYHQRVTCGHCGSVLHVTRNNAPRAKGPIVSYRCKRWIAHRALKDGKRCPFGSVRVEYIEPLVTEAVADFLLADPDGLAKSLRAASGTKGKKATRKELERKLRRIEDQRKRTQDAYIKHRALNDDEFTARIRELEDERKAIQGQLEALDEPDALNASLADAVVALAGLEAMTSAERREAMRAANVRAEVVREGKPVRGKRPTVRVSALFVGQTRFELDAARVAAGGA